MKTTAKSMNIFQNITSLSKENSVREGKAERRMERNKRRIHRMWRCYMLTGGGGRGWAVRGEESGLV
jgi:hypothetical protein